ncbi:hypothetical protein CRUP_002748 [Coryphaenoides rupestris]|nr:hypothetical protein CRUP_002748 [Coryphaenoides rupestris]
MLSAMQPVSEEIEMHIETSEYQSYPGNDTEKIVPDLTVNPKRPMRLVFLTVSLLCFLQALLNITLRIGWRETGDPTETTCPNLTRKSFWALGQPDNDGGEDCGEIRTAPNFSGFNDVDCRTKRTWICEKTHMPIEQNRLEIIRK